MLQITPWERAALVLLAADTTTDDIARRLGLSNSEFERRLASLFSRMGAVTRNDAIAAALRRGLLVSS